MKLKNVTNNQKVEAEGADPNGNSPSEERVLTAYSSNWPGQEGSIPIPDGVYSGGTSESDFSFVADVKDFDLDPPATRILSEEERWLEAIIYPIVHLVQVSYKGRSGFGPQKLALAEKLAQDLCQNPETSIPQINESVIKQAIVNAVSVIKGLSYPSTI